MIACRGQLVEVGGKGFTLIELLAAIAVFALVAILLTGILTATNRVTSLSNQSVDAAAQARLAFDRLAIDLSEIILSQDADLRVRNGEGVGDQEFTLLAYVPSIGLPSAESRGLSVVSYTVATHPDNRGRPCLLRGGKPVSWTDRGFLGKTSEGLRRTFSDPEFPANLQIEAADLQILSPGLIRMVAAFQLKSSAGTVLLADGSSVEANGGFVYSPPVRQVTSAAGVILNQVDTSRIAGVLFGVVAMDLRSLNLLDAAQVISLAEAFPTPQYGVLPLALWRPIAEDAGALPTAVPLAARQGLRVFQRYFPLLDQGGLE